MAARWRRRCGDLTGRRVAHRVGPFHFSRNESFVQRESWDRSTRSWSLTDFRFSIFLRSRKGARWARGRARGSAEELVVQVGRFHSWIPHRCRGTIGGKTRTSDVIASRCLASDWLADSITCQCIATDSRMREPPLRPDSSLLPSLFLYFRPPTLAPSRSLPPLSSPFSLRNPSLCPHSSSLSSPRSPPQDTTWLMYLDSCFAIRGALPARSLPFFSSHPCFFNRPFLDRFPSLVRVSPRTKRLSPDPSNPVRCVFMNSLIRSYPSVPDSPLPPFPFEELPLLVCIFFWLILQFFFSCLPFLYIYKILIPFDIFNFIDSDDTNFPSWRNF